MESSDGRRKGKRILNDEEDDYNPTLASTQVEIPAFHKSSPPRILRSGGQKLQLYFETKMPTFLYTGDNVKGEGESEIRVALRDLNNGSVVKTGPFSAAKLNIVVLHGDFDEEISDGWKPEFFKSRQVEKREGKRPILVKDVQVKLKGGVGILGDFSFTDNSSWTRSKKFRLGLEPASELFAGIRVMEGKTNAFRVLDGRGKYYKKHDIPALHDKVWRLYGIAKDGKLHKSLASAKIDTVKELLCLHAEDPQRLKDIIGKETEAIIQHAMRSGFTFNHIHEPGPAVPLDSLDQTQKISQSVQQIWPNCTSAPSVLQQLLEPPFSSVVPEKCFHQNNWTGPEDLYGERNPSGVNDKPETDEFNIGDIWSTDEFNIDDIWSELFQTEPHFDGPLEAEPVYSAAKAVIGWLKIKAILKWGIAVRNSAARKRAKLTEFLD